MVGNCRRACFKTIAVAVVVLAMLNPALAIQPNERLADPALEARARALSVDLRCLVCQNQSIDDSDAPLAKDLRVLVRERLQAGDSDAQVMSFVVDRYGEFVLLRPTFGWHTLLLWLAPALVLAGGIALAYRTLHRSQGPSAAVAAAEERPLTAEEQERIDRLMREG